MKCFVRFWSHPLITYAKLSEKLTFLIRDMHTYVCVSGGRNISFSENFADVLNG